MSSKINFGSETWSKQKKHSVELLVGKKVKVVKVQNKKVVSIHISYQKLKKMSIFNGHCISFHCKNLIFSFFFNLIISKRFEYVMKILKIKKICI